MTEVERIIDGMSAPELQMLAERGYRLPRRLLAKLDAWRQEQHDGWIEGPPADRAARPKTDEARTAAKAQ